MPKKYRVFIRSWWKRNSAWPNGLEPCAGSQRNIARGKTYDDARTLCEHYNSTHRPGKLSRKAEFTEE